MPQDPQAEGTLCFMTEQYAAVEGADALVLVTEWPQFRAPDFARLRTQMRYPVVIDGRNQYQPDEVREMGFRYQSVGRP